MKDFLAHARVYILRGLLAIIPLSITVLVLQFLYVFIDQKILRLFDDIIRIKIPGLGILILLTILYAIGMITTNVIGRQLFHLFERIFERIPLVKTTYHIGKQLSMTFSLPEKQLFKRVVRVEFKSGLSTLGFVTGTIKDKRHHNEEVLKVFIPTVPNPTTGFVVLVKASEAVDSGWSVDEALKVIVSGGILGPEQIG